MRPVRFGLWAGLLLAGCSSSPLGLGLGTGLSTGTLYRRAEAQVLAADREAAPDCEHRHVIQTEVVEGPRRGETAYDAMYTHGLSGNDPMAAPSPSGTRILEQSRIVERWSVDRCGKFVRYRVTFQPGKAKEREIEVVAEP